MSKKKVEFPFSEEVKMMKNHFKQMIDEMSDEEFLDFILYITSDIEDMEDDWLEDEDWEDAAEEFYSKGKHNIKKFPKFIDDEELPF